MCNATALCGDFFALWDNFCRLELKRRQQGSGKKKGREKRRGAFTDPLDCKAVGWAGPCRQHEKPGKNWNLFEVHGTAFFDFNLKINNYICPAPADGRAPSKLQLYNQYFELYAAIFYVMIGAIEAHSLALHSSYLITCGKCSKNKKGKLYTRHVRRRSWLGIRGGQRTGG